MKKPATKPVYSKPWNVRFTVEQREKLEAVAPTLVGPPDPADLARLALDLLFLHLADGGYASVIAQLERNEAVYVLPHKKAPVEPGHKST